MDWSGRTVLVTGSEGLMGKPLVRMLEERGAETTKLDKVLGHDLLFPSWFASLFQHQAVIFHLAAQSGVEAARETPWDAWNLHVMGTLNVLESIRLHSPNMQTVVIVASSNHIYGPQTMYPTTEDAPLNQLDTYSASKIAVDVLTRSYWHNYGVKTAVVRNTNVYGPDDPHSDHLIPGTILSLLRGEAPVIHGNGETYKSYVHVDDMMEAYILLAEALLEGRAGYGEAWNVSDQSGWSVGEVVDMIGNTGISAVSSIVEGEVRDQANEYLDASKIHKVTGWKPKRTLEQGLREVMDAFRARQEA